jgi:hypothetical protein
MSSAGGAKIVSAPCALFQAKAVKLVQKIQFRSQTASGLFQRAEAFCIGGAIVSQGPWKALARGESVMLKVGSKGPISMLLYRGTDLRPPELRQGAWMMDSINFVVSLVVACCKRFRTFAGSQPLLWAVRRTKAAWRKKATAWNSNEGLASLDRWASRPERAAEEARLGGGPRSGLRQGFAPPATAPFARLNPLSRCTRKRADKLEYTRTCPLPLLAMFPRHPMIPP